MTSYGFAPGGTPFDLAAAAYVALLANTKVINQSSDAVPKPLTTLQEFITEVATGTQTVRPIDDLQVVSHGTSLGAMVLQLDKTRTGGTFEEVADAATAGTIAFPTAARDPRPTTPNGVPVPCVVHIIGCFIGIFDPYVRRFRKALGEGALGVSAPAHWDSFFSADGAAILGGSLRFMLYDFRVSSPDEVPDRNALIDAFVAKQYRRIDSGLVPRSVFERAIPGDFQTIGRVQPVSAVRLKPKAGGVSWVRARGVYDHSEQSAGPFTLPGSPAVATPAQSRAFVESGLRTFPVFKADHPLPMHVRAGFASLTEFVNGYNWLQLANDQWIGFRHLYMCGVPIVDPANNNNELVHDYLSLDGTVKRLTLSNNPNLFARVFTSA